MSAPIDSMSLQELAMSRIELIGRLDESMRNTQVMQTNLDMIDHRILMLQRAKRGIYND